MKNHYLKKNPNVYRNCFFKREISDIFFLIIYDSSIELFGIIYDIAL